MGSNEGSSKGPSSTDPGIEGAFGGGGPSTAPSYTGGNDLSSVAGSYPSAGSNSNFYFGAPNAMGGSGGLSFGTSGSFSASDGATLPGGMASGGTPSPWGSSIASPEGITQGGTSGGGTSAAGLAPVGGGGPIDLTSLTGGSQGGIGSDYAASSGASGGPTALTPEQMGAPAAGGAGAGAAGKPAASGGGIMESLGIKNPLGSAIGLGGLAYAMSQGQQQQKYSPELLAQAQRLDANGQAMMSYLQSGNLPPGLKASLDQATGAAKAKIISNFASQGMNTDPTQNTALAAQLAQVEQQALISTAQIGQQLMSSGIQQSGLSSDLYKTLANIDQTQTASIGKAIANFASSLGGAGSGINLKLG